MANKIISADKFRDLVYKARGDKSLRTYAAELGFTAQYLQSVESGKRPASPAFAALPAFNVDELFVCVPVTAYELVPHAEWRKENGPLPKYRIAEKPAPAKKARKAKPKPKPRKRKPAPKAEKKQLELVVPLEPLTTDQKKANRNGHKRSDAQRSVLIAKATELRNEGVSFGDIAKRVGVPKASVIGWLKKAS